MLIAQKEQVMTPTIFLFGTTVTAISISYWLMTVLFVPAAPPLQLGTNNWVHGFSPQGTCILTKKYTQPDMHAAFNTFLTFCESGSNENGHACLQSVQTSLTFLQTRPSDSSYAHLKVVQWLRPPTESWTRSEKAGGHCTDGMKRLREKKAKKKRALLRALSFLMVKCSCLDNYRHNRHKVQSSQ